MEVAFPGDGDARGSGGRFQACPRPDVHRRLLRAGRAATSPVALKRVGHEPSETGRVPLPHPHGADAPYHLSHRRPAAGARRSRRHRIVLTPMTAASLGRERIEHERVDDGMAARP
ncbi:hypothetical protein ACQP1W_12365 [Spirillospora sp. CA-255316]